MLVYIAHPVGTDPIEFAKNLANVQRWFKFLIDNTDWSLSVPWFIYVSNLDEDKYRARGVRDDLVSLERCDGIVLVGGRISNGMKTELGLAEIAGQKILDLTSAGYSPDENPESAKKLINAFLEEYPV